VSLPAEQEVDGYVDTERYPSVSQPPISCVRICVRERDVTLRSAPVYARPTWPKNLALLASVAAIVDLSMSLPLLPTLGLMLATLALVLLARLE
jgi:hypothetical protein